MIEILIPTFNRPQSLYRVLESIYISLNSNKCKRYKSLFKIRIHEDYSENTASKFKISKLLKDIPYEYKLYKNNKGIIEGLLSLFKKASEDYVLWHSDDDFLHKSYFYEVANLLDQQLSENYLCILAKNYSRTYSLGESLELSKKPFPINDTIFKRCDNFIDKVNFACRAHQLTGLVLPKKGLKVYLENDYILKNYHPCLGAAVTSIFKLKATPILLSNHSAIISKQNEKSWTYNDDYFFFDIQQHFAKIFKGFKSIYASVIIFIFFNDKYLLKPFKFFKFISKKLSILKIFVLILVAIVIKFLKIFKIILLKLKKSFIKLFI